MVVSCKVQWEMAVHIGLIDPYGIVTDILTGDPIEGVKMSLYWADTKENISNGRKADSLVELPILPSFEPNQNKVPQITTAKGEYAWMVYPDGDYYIIAEKIGYFTYDSREEKRNQSAKPGEDSWITDGIIHVGQAIVKYDFQMMSEDMQIHEHYINGYGDKTFRPDQPITRAEVATILTRILDIEVDTVNQEIFTDSKGHWASEYIQAAGNKGYMEGYPDDSFKPDKNITRGEMATIIQRIKELEKYKNSFIDAKDHWSANNIGAIEKVGYIKGYEDGTFRPDKMLTRAEAITIINQMLQRGNYKETPEKTVNIWKDVLTSHWAYWDIIEASIDHVFEYVDGQEANIEFK